MKNKIFKSYAKKILRSEAFVSVIIVFVLALGIIGSSYALYMDVDTDTDYQLVQVGELSIGFNNGSSLITLDNMTPTSNDIATGKVTTEENISSKNLTSFYIYNTGTYTANYKIKLVPVDGNQVETKFINYQICRDNADNCRDIGTLNDSGETTIYTDELTPNSTAIDTNSTNPSAYYFVRLWINDQYSGGNEAKTIMMQIVVEATNASGYLDNNNTLAGRILNDSRITINNNQPNFNSVETAEVGLYKAEDDYGTSYYFRGAQSNNYVNFAGFTWRIVRINGDGSVRLILDGRLDKITKEGESSPVYQNTNLSALDSDGKIAFNSTYNDNAYLGYMFGATGKSDYDSTHKNLNDSTIKTYIDTFYEEYILEYQDYISDTMFCGDKSLASSTIGSSNTALGYGKNKTYYATTERLYYSTGTTSITTATPTLECAKGATNTYSRYTVDSYTTTNGVNTNGDLTYPIALLSADELVMAGAFNRTANKSYYLYDAYANETSYNYWWTMSPYYFTGSYAYEFHSFVVGNSLNYTNLSSSHGSRPVINLRADSLVVSGDGTSTYTYDSEGNILTGPYTVTVK